jgi:hypothetical protein
MQTQSTQEEKDIISDEVFEIVKELIPLLQLEQFVSISPNDIDFAYKVCYIVSEYALATHSLAATHNGRINLCWDGSVNVTKNSKTKKIATVYFVSRCSEHAQKNYPTIIYDATNTPIINYNGFAIDTVTIIKTFANFLVTQKRNLGALEVISSDPLSLTMEFKL